MNKLYYFRPARKRGELLIESLIEYNEQDLKRGKLSLEKPFVVKVSEGKKFYDILGFQDPFNFAISERVYKLLTDAGVTGWGSYEIVIEGRSEKYYGFQVLGRCGALKRPKEAGFVMGFDFDRETWDGSDFFCPEGTLTIFCTERVKELFNAHKFTNIDELREIDTVKWYST